MRVLLAIALLTGCGAPEGDDRDVRWLDDDVFAADVQTILADGCGNPSCHGRADRPFSVYSPGHWRENVDDTYLPGPISARELEHNYTVSCVLVSEADVPEESLLLRKTLGEAAGVYHGGGAIFEDTTERDYRTLLQWVEGGWE